MHLSIVYCGYDEYIIGQKIKRYGKRIFIGKSYLIQDGDSMDKIQVIKDILISPVLPEDECPNEKYVKKNNILYITNGIESSLKSYTIPRVIESLDADVIVINYGGAVVDIHKDTNIFPCRTRVKKCRYKVPDGHMFISAIDPHIRNSRHIMVTESGKIRLGVVNNGGIDYYT